MPDVKSLYANDLGFGFRQAQQ